MKILCIGAGPAGLYAALLLQRQGHAVTVAERRPLGEPAGWGVVFSDATLDNLSDADPASAQALAAAFHHWDGIDIHYQGETIRAGGHGFNGIARTRLLAILRGRCEEEGVALCYGTEHPERAGFDLIIGADGVNSSTRTRHAASFKPELAPRHCRYLWLGTRKRFDAFTFAFVETPHGWFQAHAYQYDQNTSTFIVEAPDTVWRAAGVDATAQGLAYFEQLFAHVLGGAALLAGAGEANTFTHVRCAYWVHWDGAVPTVLIGDAAHTAHFSIGSGTRMALEDAIELARCIGAGGDLRAALATYESRRSIEVLKLQNAARNSMEWFENVARYSRLAPPQFAYAALTRSQRIAHENLRLRDPAFVARVERWVAGDPAHASAPVPPMFTPYRIRAITLKNRIVVSPMAQYMADEGVVGDYHLMHLGARASGGAALVMAEMTAVLADARITPRCPGLYTAEQEAAWRRITGFVHAHTDAKIGIQLGHAGPKGSTKTMAEGIDQPLDTGNWPLVAASAQQYLPGVSQLARALTHADMERIEADFVRAAQAAVRAGFDWLELHCAHGYLLSSFISPLTNQRSDDYGGTLDNRCRFPLRVLRAVRAVWPAHLPISVRISAHDWVEGGTTPTDAVQIARLFKEAGADMIDCSSGQVSRRERPQYGRMYQTPFADRIRNEADIPTIAVGAIYEADHANSIIAAGRADLCAVGRPHLANPAWTLHEAARIAYTGIGWPAQYAPAKRQLERGQRQD